MARDTVNGHSLPVNAGMDMTDHSADQLAIVNALRSIAANVSNEGAMTPTSLAVLDGFGINGVGLQAQSVSVGAIAMSPAATSIGGLTIDGTSYGADSASIISMRDLTETLRTTVASLTAAVNNHDELLVKYGFSK